MLQKHHVVIVNSLKRHLSQSQTSLRNNAEIHKANHSSGDQVLVFLWQMFGHKTSDEVTAIWLGPKDLGERLTHVTVHVISSSETLSHIITASRRGGLDQNTGFALSFSASLLHPASSPQMIYNAHDSLYSQIKIRNTTREAIGFVYSRWRLITRRDHHAHHVPRDGGGCLTILTHEHALQVALAGDFTRSNTATCTQDAMQAYLEADTAGKDCSSHAMPMPGGPAQRQRAASRL